MTTLNQNDVLLEGRPTGEAIYSHENHGIRFFRFFLEVPRLSGTPDTLPVIVPETMLGCLDGVSPLYVRGQLRSYNNRSGVGNKLVLAVYAAEIRPGMGEVCNQILLTGTLCKPPVFRRTPLGRSICDLMLAVPRRYGRADYLPVIAWGQLAVEVSSLCVGDRLSMEGRVQSRIYHKVTDSGTEERTAYEVSMMHLLS